MIQIAGIIAGIKKSPLFKDSFWALLGNLVRQGLALISGIVVARFLGKELYGEFGTIRTTLVYIAIVSTFGFGYTATKYVAEYLQNRQEQVKALVSVILKITLIFSCLLAIGLFVFSRQIAVFLDAPHLASTLRLSAVVVVVNAVNSTQIAILSGFKAFKEIARVNAYSGVVTFFSSVLLTYCWGLDGAVIALLIAFLFQALLNERVIHKLVGHYPGSLGIEKKIIQKMLVFSMPIALQESLYTVIHWLLMLILIKYANYGEVGISSAAGLWQSVVIFIPGVLKNVMFSHIVTATDHERMVNRLLLIHFVTTIIPVVVVVLFSNIIVSFYGTNFNGLHSVLIVQVCSAIFICLSEVYCYEFISMGRPWFVFIARFVRDMGIVLVGYWVVKNIFEHQALRMSYVSLTMNVFFLVILFVLYHCKIKITCKK